MEKLQINCLSTDAIEQVMANDLLDNLIVNAITTIRDNIKRPDALSIFNYLHKTVGNRSVTKQILESTKAATGSSSYIKMFLTISGPGNQSCSEYVLVLFLLGN